MAGHEFEIKEVERRLNESVGKTLGDIDTIHETKLFDNVGQLDSQKGIAGAVVEQSIFGYQPDQDQAADLLIKFGTKGQRKVELKTTGVLGDLATRQFYAKEKLSITAVSIFELTDQKFACSHFWEKVGHILFVYYFYSASRRKKVLPSEYKDFQIVGYHFFEPTSEERCALKSDWNNVYELVNDIVQSITAKKGSRQWKDKVKTEYIRRHREIKNKGLNLIVLAPTYPPRFQLKKDYLSEIIARKFDKPSIHISGYPNLSKIWNRLKTVSKMYKGKTLEDIASILGVKINGNGEKNVAENVLIRMFDNTCSAKKLNQVDIFRSKSIIAKTVVFTAKSWDEFNCCGRGNTIKRLLNTKSCSLAEDMKMFTIDFDELVEKEVIDSDKKNIYREKEWVDSDFYQYFSENEFLAIVFIEPPTEYYVNVSGKRQKKNHPLKGNKFLGFKRLRLEEETILKSCEILWKDCRKKISDKTLKEIKFTRGGKEYSAPNFMKAAENEIFVRGSSTNSSEQYKVARISGLELKMIPQCVWISRKRVKNLLDDEKYL